MVRHGSGGTTPALPALSGVLAAYAGGVAGWDALGRRGRLGWLLAVVACWLVLVAMAPSFAWCAVPLFFAALRPLSPRAAVIAVMVLTGAVVFAGVYLADRVDPSLVLGVTGSVQMARVLTPARPGYTVVNRFGGTSLIPAAERGHAA